MSKNVVDQVGGDHYQAEYQHWDLVQDLQVPYLEAVATKYLTRAHKKNGLEDLKKSLSYVDKLIGFQRIGNAWPPVPVNKLVRLILRVVGLLPGWSVSDSVVGSDYKTRRLRRIAYFFEVNQTPIEVQVAFSLLLVWETRSDLENARARILRLIRQAEHTRMSPKA